MMKRIEVPPVELWSQVATTKDWCALLAGEDYATGTPSEVLRVEAEQWAQGHGYSLLFVVNAEDSVSVRMIRPGARELQDVDPRFRAVSRALQSEKREMTPTNLLAVLDANGDGKLFGGDGQRSRAVRLGHLLSEREWAPFLKFRVLNGSRLWSLKPAEGRALWDPRTRLLRIELDGQQSIEVHDVHTPSAELDNRDLVPGPTITDETGVKITPIREV
jgi:hypothetical protein